MDGYVGHGQSAADIWCKSQRPISNNGLDEALPFKKERALQKKYRFTARHEPWEAKFASYDLKRIPLGFINGDLITTPPIPGPLVPAG